MSSVIAGKDIWMGKDEVLTRWSNKLSTVDAPIGQPLGRKGRPRKLGE